MLLAAVRKIEHRGAYDLAHRELQVASQMFRNGVATDRCERDPAPDLRGALTPHRGRHQAAATPEELPALLRAIDGYGELGDKLTGYALRLLALTFVRTNELVGAEWAEFDLDAAVWIIPATRMKMKTEHVVPLSRQAVTLLREVYAIGGGSRYVFPGRNPDKPISNNTAPGLPSLLVFAFLAGFNYGGVLVLYASTVARRWGLQHVGQVYGLLFTANIVASPAPMAAGFSLDIFGSFVPAFVAFALVAAGAALQVGRSVDRRPRA